MIFTSYSESEKSCALDCMSLPNSKTVLTPADIPLRAFQKGKKVSLFALRIILTGRSADNEYNSIQPKKNDLFSPERNSGSNKDKG